MSPELAAVCSTGLAKKPDDRYQSAGEFLAALETAARGSYGAAWAAGAALGALVGVPLGVVATGTDTTVRVRRRPTRLRVLGAVTAIALVTAAAVLLVAHHHDRHAPASAAHRAVVRTGSATSSSHRSPNAVGSPGVPFAAPAALASNVYYAASCPTPRTCLATGQNPSGRPLLSVTHDAGATWTTGYPAVPGTLGLLSCSDPKTCVAGYFDTAIHMRRTTDGGHTWSAATTPHVTNLQSISCPTPTQCLAVGGAVRNGSGTAQAIATSDGGRSWHSVAVPGPADSVSCAGAAHCWVSGVDKVWATDAAGSSWQLLSPPSTFPPTAHDTGPFPANTTFPVSGGIGGIEFDLAGVAFSNEQDGIAFGGAQCGGYKITRCTSGVYRTTDGAHSWTFWRSTYANRWGNGEYAACVASGCLLVTDTFTKSVLVSTADGTTWTQRRDFGQFVGRVTCSDDGSTCVVLGRAGLFVSQS